VAHVLLREVHVCRLHDVVALAVPNVEE
jgi:hypothetical protein